MAQRLGLTDSEHRRYLAHLFGNHDFEIEVEVLSTEGKVLAGVRETLLDGQVNIQPRDNAIRRTASLTFHDPDRRLGLDTRSPYATSLFLDRMVRVQHTVVVPGVGRVTATPFVGPVITVTRDGETLTVECHDKAAFAVRGRPPIRVKGGTNCVDAIRRIMAATGENRFRLPEKNDRRTPKSKPFNVGWSDEASPWTVANKIAALTGMRLDYSCDGYLTLRPLPSKPALALNEKRLTANPTVAYDATNVVNAVRVQGTIRPKKKPKKPAKDEKDKKVKVEKVAVSAIAKKRHPLSPDNLGRNGAPRYLPKFIDGDQYRRQADAADLAKRELRQGLNLASSTTTATCVPVFHLDNDDVISVATDTTTARLRLGEGSIPLGIGGDMTIGYQRAVSFRRTKPKPRRRGRGRNRG
ncbi:hypothetical protein GCM10023340_08570 [Nocardioides marinquilinus]|uniref:Uncharacterized protein n=1 Tax=Nocardioides marinquilinus TaxID=1210400 RepID=A0ABP9PAE3_9ACTN